MLGRVIADQGHQCTIGRDSARHNGRDKSADIGRLSLIKRSLFDAITHRRIRRGRRIIVDLSATWFGRFFRDMAWMWPGYSDLPVWSYRRIVGGGGRGRVAGWDRCMYAMLVRQALVVRKRCEKRCEGASSSSSSSHHHLIIMMLDQTHAPTNTIGDGVHLVTVIFGKHRSPGAIKSHSF